MKQTILDTISDLCSDFLYYDRKGDEELTMEQLDEAVKNGEITIDEMVAEFRKHLENTFKQPYTKLKAFELNKELKQKRWTKETTKQ